MKKIFAIVLTLSMMLSLVLSASAAIFDQQANNSLGFSVQYMKNSPKMDGEINDGEYYPIDLSDIDKYFNYSWGSRINSENKNTLADLKDYAKNKLKVYSCWDGKYFYLGFECNAPADQYICSPSADVYLFRAWCMQVSVNEIDTKGVSRNEVGIAYDANADTMRATAWSGDKISLKANTDYAAVWDRDAEVITYEIRIDLAKTIGQAPENDAEFLMAFCLCMGDGVEGDDSGARQIEFNGGICTSKTAKTQGVMKLTGAPDGFKGDEAESDTLAAEDQPYADIYKYTDDFRIAENAELLNLNDGKTSTEYKVDDNGDCYVRITAGEDNGYVGGNKLTGNTNFDGAKAIVIRYRTSSEKIEKLGINATNSVISKLDDEYKDYGLYKLINDGKWHTISFDMTGFDNWTQFNTGLYLYPFDGEGMTGEAFDIMWIKYYAEDRVFDNGEHTEYLDDVTDVIIEDETEPDEDDETVSDKKNDTTTDAQKSQGEGIDTTLILIIVAAVVVVAVVAAVIVITLKKKKK